MKKLFILLLMAAAMFCACDNSSDSPAATVPPVPVPAPDPTPVIMDIDVECENPADPVHTFDNAVLKVKIKDANKDAAKAYITVTWHNPSDGSGIPVEVLNEEEPIPAMAAEEEIFEYTIPQSVLKLGPSYVDGNYTVEVEIEDAASNMSAPESEDFTVIEIYS